LAETAEKMIVKLRAGMMPLPGAPRPSPDTLLALVETLETLIDDAAKEQRSPGTRPFQRLNRSEYGRLVQDILGLTVDPGEWLPADQISASFDNIADVQVVSPTLMDAYLTAASEVARQAIGQKDAPVLAKTYTNPASLSQHEWEAVEGAPYGTRGGISVLHTFPADGEYTFSMGFISGWGERFHDVDISVDGERVALVHYGGDIDFQGRKPFPVETDPVFIRAGQRRVTAAFIRQMDGPYEDLIRPNDWSLTGTETSYGTTSLPHLISLTLEGPYDAIGVSETPTRRRVFSCRPTSADEEEPCSEQILAGLAAQAYGRSLDEADVEPLMMFYRMGAEEGGFEMGVRTALEAILTSPHFLFRMETEPDGVKPGEVYELDDVDLASRLSFFLWGTNPDQELLRLAQEGDLSKPKNLERQARRLLADSRADALATRFASLWLQLQDLEKVRPDAFWFPNYSQQLVEAMRRETELFFDNLVREDRSLLELYNADYTFLNERLANHYDIPGVVGDEFRRVDYPGSRRRGVLGHGSVLVQTSLGNRTSPVLRGKWVMQVLLGTPPPPPPPGVPDLEATDDTQGALVLTTRQRMEIHRKNPVCSSCHRFMDPIGLALDNFDVTGKWRTREKGVLLDTRGTFYDGTDINSPMDLSRVLLKRPIPLVRHFTANLMAYALGRRVEYQDQPAVRAIVASAAKNDYRMSSFILGVLRSDAFRMKRASAVSEQDSVDPRLR
ncbi:MAG: DUF1592 domain-containing protein, partial [Gemmatimonadota bacterium]|nr:DUF1592 domain-containing protein [Gemmatimonadota bacterium]